MPLPARNHPPCISLLLCFRSPAPPSHPHPQSLLRARPTVSPDEMKSYEKFTAEFGEEG